MTKEVVPKMNPDLLTWPQRGQLWLRLGIRAALVIGAVLLTVFVAVPLVSLLMPFVLALVLAWLLNPVVRWLKNRLNISRKVISLAVLVLAFGTVGGLCYGLCWALVNQVISLFDNWQPILDSLMATVDNVGHWLDRLGDILPNSLVATGDDWCGRWPAGWDEPGPVQPDCQAWPAGPPDWFPAYQVLPWLWWRFSWPAISLPAIIQGCATCSRINFQEICGSSEARCGVSSWRRSEGI